MAKGLPVTIPKFNSLPNDKILDWSKLKAFADDKINLNKTRCVCETLMPLKWPFLEKCNIDIRP